MFEYFAECDEIWHAGDFGSIEVLTDLQTFKPLRGVSGNVDGADIRMGVPEDSTWDCEGVRVYMTHIGGYPGNYDRRAKRELERLRPDVFICGHSHILRVMRDQDLKLLHMNPGACGHNGWHKMRTVLRFGIEQGKISGVEAIELGVRGRKHNA